MIIELIQNILNYSESIDQINCIQIDKYIYDNSYIFRLCDLGECTKNLDQDIIRQRKYSKLVALDCQYSTKLYDLDHVCGTLEELVCGNSIEQSGIMNLKKLKKISCVNNIRINNLNHLKETLEDVDCSASPPITSYEPNNDMNWMNNMSGMSNMMNNMNQKTKYYHNTICQTGIAKLKKIKKLNHSYNSNIVSLEHFAETLEELHCEYENGKDRSYNIHEELSNLKKIRILNCNHNYGVHKYGLPVNLNNMLEELHYRKLGIDQNVISRFNGLKHLDIMDGLHHNINLSSLGETLEILKCNGNVLGMGSLKKIRVLHLKSNSDRLYCNVDIYSDTVEELYCEDSYIGQHAISKMKKLKKLNCSGCQYIFDVNHLSKTLRKLIYNDKSGITPKGIFMLSKRTKIICNSSSK